MWNTWGKHTQTHYFTHHAIHLNKLADNTDFVMENPVISLFIFGYNSAGLTSLFDCWVTHYFE